MSLSDVQPRHEPPPDLAAALAHASARLGPFGRQVHWYPLVPSTNDLAAALAERGAPEGAMVIADAQSAGRGRHGRTWCSPPGAGLYVSIVLRPTAEAAPLVTLAAGVGLAEGIAAATGLRPALKWPNDLVIVSPSAAMSKLAGILVEASHGGAAVQSCVLGFGINLRPAAYPPDVAARATSLEGELGRGVDGPTLLVACLASLAARYDDIQERRPAAVLDAWREHARPLLGRRVEWTGREGARRGVAEDVDAQGALVVRTPEGSTRVISGEVRWI